MEILAPIIAAIMALFGGDDAQTFGASIFTVRQGGTGTSTITRSHLLYGAGTDALQSVATTSASCSGNASCSSFTVIGTSPVTISASGGGSGSGSISTSSPGVISSLLYFTTAGATPELVNPVATTTVTATSPLSLSNPVAKVGGTNSVLSISTTTNSLFTGTAGQVLAYTSSGWTGTATTTFSSGLLYSNGNVTNTGVTSLSGTAQQISASGSTGAVTLSLPSYVLFPGDIRATEATTTRFNTTHATATNATTTILHVSSLFSFNSVVGNSWDDFCTAITGGSGLCDGSDATGAGGAAAVATSTNETAGRLSYWTSNSGTPATLGEVATTTLTATTPLSLSQTVVKVGGSNSVLTIATTTDSLFAGSAGQVLARTSSGWTGVATTTFSGGLTYSSGNVTNTLTAGDGITRNTDDLDCDTASGSVFGCLSTTDWTTFNTKLGSYDAFTHPIATHSATTTPIRFTGGFFASSTVLIDNSTTTNATTTSLAILNLTAASCDVKASTSGVLSCGTDAVGGGSDYDAWLHPSTNVSATTSGIIINAASSSIVGDLNITGNATATNATTTVLFSGLGRFTTAIVTNLFIGADTIAEYIADTAGAMFTGNTETDITVTYDDADNTVDFVVDTLPNLTGTLDYDSGGTGSTTAPVSQLLYGGASAYQSVATSAPSVTAPITYSGTLGSLVGGISGAFGCTNASSGVTGCLTGTDWTTFNSKLGAYNPFTNPTATTFATTSGMVINNASSTIVGSLNITGNSTTTNATTTSLAVLNLNAASCDVKASTSGVLSCGTDATGGGGGTPDSKWATSTLTNMIYTAGAQGAGIGTSTPWGSLHLASTTPYLVFTDTDAAVDSKHLIFSNNGGILRFGKLNDALTSTTSAFQIDPSGEPKFGIGTSSPYAALSVVGEVVARNFTATSSTATSSFTHLTISGNASTSNLIVSNLNTSTCDVKANTFGVLSCGVDATGLSAYDAFTHPIAGVSATTTPIRFTGGLYASSTVLIDTATTTALGVLNLNASNCDVKSTTAGILFCGTDATSAGAADPFQFETNFGITTAATSSAIWAKLGIMASSTLNLHKGTTSVPPLRFFEGATTTTATDGYMEMNGNTFYGTTDDGNRGYIPVKHFIRASSTKTFTSNTSEQAIFTGFPTTNGRITLETGLYRFEGLILVTGMSATSGNGAIDILGAGTAVIADWAWHVVGGDATPGAAGAAQGGSWHQAQQTNTNAVTAGTGTGMSARVRGTFEVTTAGTMIPSFTMTTASASILQPGSYMMFERIGAINDVYLGQWD